MVLRNQRGFIQGKAVFAVIGALGFGAIAGGVAAWKWTSGEQELARAHTEQARADVRKLEAEKGALHTQAMTWQAQADLYRNQAEGVRFEAEKAKADAERSRAEAEKLRAEYGKLSSEALKLGDEARKLQAEAGKLQAENEKLAQEKKKLEEETAALRANARLHNAEAFPREISNQLIRQFLLPLLNDPRTDAAYRTLLETFMQSLGAFGGDDARRVRRDGFAMVPTANTGGGAVDELRKQTSGSGGTTPEVRVVSVQGLNMRRGAGQGYDAVTELRKGDEVTLLGGQEMNGPDLWLRVRFRHVDGWVHSRHLTTKGSASSKLSAKSG